MTAAGVPQNLVQVAPQERLTPGEGDQGGPGDLVDDPPDLGGGQLLLAGAPLGRADAAVTMSFMTVGLAQVFHVFNSRKERGPLRPAEWSGNLYVIGAVVLTIGLQIAAVYMPGLNTVLKTVPLHGADWLVIAGCAMTPLVVGQTLRRLAMRRTPVTNP